MNEWRETAYKSLNNSGNGAASNTYLEAVLEESRLLRAESIKSSTMISDLIEYKNHNNEWKSNYDELSGKYEGLLMKFDELEATAIVEKGDLLTKWLHDIETINCLDYHVEILTKQMKEWQERAYKSLNNSGNGTASNTYLEAVLEESGLLRAESIKSSTMISDSIEYKNHNN